MGMMTNGTYITGKNLLSSDNKYKEFSVVPGTQQVLNKETCVHNSDDAHNSSLKLPNFLRGVVPAT